MKEKICFYKEIEAIFDIDNFEEIKDNLVLLDISLQKIYGEEVEKISSIVHRIFLNIEKYSTANHHEKELKKEF